jgi:Uma2 family endonuclease
MPQLSDGAFFLLCEQQVEHRIERDAQGKFEILPGTGGEMGSRNAELVYQLRAWSRRSEGVSFDSSTMFRLPDSSMRSPDSAWVPKARLASLSAVEKKKFIPLCPDFVVELLSPSDRLSQVQAKMRNGSPTARP